MEQSINDVSSGVVNSVTPAHHTIDTELCNGPRLASLKFPFPFIQDGTIVALRYFSYVTVNEKLLRELSIVA